MTTKLLTSLLLAVAFTAPSSLFAQGPDGTDINKAIPIYFGQTITDIGDGSTRSYVVYSITLAKGQSVTFLASKLAPVNSGSEWGLFLFRPSTATVKAYQSGDILACLGIGCSAGSNTAAVQTFVYQTSVAGTYYIMPQFRSTGINYSLVVTAQGTPIAVPNPPARAASAAGSTTSLTPSN